MPLVDASAFQGAALELQPHSAVPAHVLRTLLARCGPYAACYGIDIATFLGGDLGHFVVALGTCLCLRAYPHTGRLGSPTDACNVLLAAVAAVAKRHLAPSVAAAVRAQLVMLESDLPGIEDLHMRGAHPGVAATEFAAFCGGHTSRPSAVAALTTAGAAQVEPRPIVAPAPHAAAVAASAVGSQQEANSTHHIRPSAVAVEGGYLPTNHTPSPAQSNDNAETPTPEVATMSRGGHSVANITPTTASPTPPNGTSKAARRRARRRALEQNGRRSAQQHSTIFDESTATDEAGVLGFGGSIVEPVASAAVDHRAFAPLPGSLAPLPGVHLGSSTATAVVAAPSFAAPPMNNDHPRPMAQQNYLHHHHHQTQAHHQAVGTTTVQPLPMFVLSSY